MKNLTILSSIARRPASGALFRFQEGGKERVVSAGETWRDLATLAAYMEGVDPHPHSGPGLPPVAGPRAPSRELLNNFPAVGLIGPNSYSWLTAEFAALLGWRTPTALYDSFGPDALVSCAASASLRLLFVAPTTKDLGFLSDTDIRTVVLLGERADGLRAKATVPSSVSVVGWADALADGAARLDGSRFSPDPTTYEETDESISGAPSLLMYTSGTTGTPKGVLHTHASIAAATASLTALHNLRPTDRYFSYLPLAHIFERVTVQAILRARGSVSFGSGSIATLLADIPRADPTIFVGVPRVWERVGDGIRAAWPTKGPAKWYADAALARLRRRADAVAAGQVALDSPLPRWTRPLVEKMRAKLGPNLRLAVSGGAPLDHGTADTLRILLNVTFVQGYGLTESAACGALGTAEDVWVHRDTGVGTILPGLEVDLKPVPEMGYVDAKVDGGEVLLRGPMVARGYLDSPAHPDFDEDGWFHTGDIGRLSERGTLAIIDRKKNLFKLANGEYVASERLEAIYKRSDLAAHVFVTGESTDHSAAALVALDPVFTARWAEEQGVAEEEVERLIVPALVADFGRLADEARLQPYERIHRIAVTRDEWNADSPVMTPSFKLKRHALLSVYGEKLEQVKEHRKK